MNAKKKVVSFVLSILTIVGMAMSASAASVFTDVSEGAWYYGAVMAANDKGYMSGTGDGKFSPNNPMTRAMFVQLIANFSNDYKAENYANKSRYTDVSADAWYAAAVECAAVNNIASGTSETQFSPGKNLTRQEMVTMLYNYAVITGNDTSFSTAKMNAYTDKDSVSEWAVKAMAWATDKGIISGTSETMLSPQNQTTRAEVASMITKAEVILVKRNLSTGTETGTENPSGSESKPDETKPGENKPGENNGNPELVTDEKENRPTGFSEVDADGGYYDYDLANATMDSINELRKEHNLPPLAYSLKVKGWADIRSREVWEVCSKNSQAWEQVATHTRPDGSSFATVGSVSGENNLATGEYCEYLQDNLQYDENGNKYIEVTRTVDNGDGTGTSYTEKLTEEEYMQYMGAVVMEGWWVSTPHRMNMLSKGAQTGVVSCYVKDGKIYCTHLFSAKPVYILNQLP